MRRIRDIVLFIKRDKMHAETRRPYVELVVERMASGLGLPLRDLFAGDTVLVPVPGAGLTRPNTVWPALSICRALLGAGLGASMATVLRRTRAVPKSAGSQNRLPLREHYDSFAVQSTLDRPAKIVLVDDVVTSGTTLMASAKRLHEAFPQAVIAAFALARVQSGGEAPVLFEPLIERVVGAGARCRREPSTQGTPF